MYGSNDYHNHWELESQISDVKSDLSRLKYNSEGEIPRLEYRINDIEYAQENIRNDIYQLEQRVGQLEAQQR